MIGITISLSLLPSRHMLMLVLGRKGMPKVVSGSLVNWLPAEANCKYQFSPMSMPSTPLSNHNMEHFQYPGRGDSKHMI